ncbi:hypothetical protein [Acaryochloris sp. CCMEE 5410]|uniref:hypothetical protein n=1 Tax=Acaryochloris sp. CCMEE 5410 TaxID=310037 RepID=UPI0002483F80|nr:hypothetical protein [Acaryochloris sp. CCMEE 5410]KAI9129552.1 hypothetical protein ON05_033115 [Acaryochloris sp. CCMEE 5410]
MKSDEIEGWRVGLKSETQVGIESQTLEISGPGNLKIEIQRFKSVEVTIEGFVNLEMAPTKFFELSCKCYDSVNKCKVSLDYYFTGEPEAYLIVGCAHWVIPIPFAQQLVHVFLLG